MHANAPSSFDPWGGALRWASLYGEFHEWAHVEQCCRRSTLWRAWERLRPVPVAGHLAMLAVEIEAALLARRDLRACGLWGREEAQEAARGLLTYVRALTIF